MAGVGLLNWPQDRYLNHYGLKISPNPSKVKARVLPSPSVQFGPGGQSKVDTGDLVKGRWRLDGRKFVLSNTDKPIKAWGVCVIQGRGSAPQPAVEKFMQQFVSIYESHGGKISSHPTNGKKPWMGPGNLADGGELVAKAFNACGNHYNARPSLMIFIVNDRNADIYRRIKKSCDIRFGVPSQCLQSKHVTACSPQYISNVLMKVSPARTLQGAALYIPSCFQKYANFDV